MYLHSDIFLTTETARHLYHKVAADLPIIDFHTHLPQQEILENHRFENLWELWLKHDHYKWRLMRTCGIDESYITGNATPREKFFAFASIMPLAVGNPVHHWAHLELQRVFNINTTLNKNTAKDIWNLANQQLQQDPTLSTRGLLDKFNVKIVCTTDDPASNLSTHQQLAQENTTLTLPTFRPDMAMAIDKPTQFKAWLKQLGKRCNTEIYDYASLLENLEKRHHDFHAAGCRLSDHGLSHCPHSPHGKPTYIELDQIFQHAASGNTPESPDHWNIFAADIMRNVAAWNTRQNWTMQLHLGPLRNVNPTMFEKLGPDTGFDTIGTWQQTDKLVHFLAELEKNNTLPRTIVYNLNPSESESICCALQNFQQSHSSHTTTNDGAAAKQTGCVQAKLQYGPAWWHLDHKRGIFEQLDILMSLSALGTSVGMLTDSRSFTSYVRHEYFRRLLCQKIGTAAEDGEIPNDPAALETLIADICYHNARNYFQWQS